MKLSTKLRDWWSRLFLVVILASGSSANAQPLSTEEWGRWNAISTPTFPDSGWKKYSTPEDAGWSSEKLAEARATSQSAGSAAVMVIYEGAVLAQWGAVERRFFCHSIR